MMLLTFRSNIKFPCVSYALVLIFIQGPLSFLADYVHVTNDSVFHVMDRILAVPMTIFELGKIIALYPHTRGGTFFCYLSFFVFAIYSFLQSQAAQSDVERERFIFWHSMWHFFPLKVSALMLFDVYVLGDHKTPTEKNGAKTKLLSTILMETEFYSKKMF